MENKELLEQIKKLQKRVELLEAKNQIENLMGHYEVLHNQKNMMLHPQDFALTMPDVSVQIVDSPERVGLEKVRELFESTYEVKDCEGIMLIHYLTTPMIEVAQDGQTARGVWWTPGIETVYRDRTKDPDAVWCFGSYANDFILENGVWKIWHMRFILVSKCNYEDGWVKHKKDYVQTAGYAKNPPPTHNPYRTDYIQESIPMAPKPYATWNDDKWYLG